jgi:hypothetical protein
MSSAATKCQVGRRMCGPKKRAAIELGSAHRSGSDGGSHAEGPQRMGVLLRLDAPKQADNVCRCRQSIAGQALGSQATAQHIGPHVG